MLTWDVFVFVQDTGISVRKRVIKIFRDICMDQPEFPKIPEMCVRMIRRVNDEEGIKVIFLSLKSRVFSMTHSLGEMYIDVDNIMIRMQSKVQRGQGLILCERL